MLISQLVLGILKNEENVSHILADYLEDKSISLGNEALHYAKRFRENTFTTQTLIDVIMKFGTNKEQKIVGKFIRHKLREYCRSLNLNKNLLKRDRHIGRCSRQESLLKLSLLFNT